MAKNIIILLVITLTIMGSQFNEAYGKFRYVKIKQHKFCKL